MACGCQKRSKAATAAANAARLAADPNFVPAPLPVDPSWRYLVNCADGTTVFDNVTAANQVADLHGCQVEAELVR